MFLESGHMNEEKHCGSYRCTFAQAVSSAQNVFLILPILQSPDKIHSTFLGSPFPIIGDHSHIFIYQVPALYQVLGAGQSAVKETGREFSFL